MRVGYVAKHDSGGNDDEGAITYALEQLGHRVERLREIVGRNAYKLECDFVLFHHWDDIESIKRIKVPTVFWYFDLVSTDDQLLHRRIFTREASVQRVTEAVSLGFLSDGDWVNQDSSGKLIWMTQGMDERNLMYTTPDPNLKLPPILFTGSVIGTKRISHIQQLQEQYGTAFNVIGSSGPRLHGRKLGCVLNNTQVVVAPDGPATDNYWSNRVYLTTGLGGFLLHPYCERLRTQYSEEELSCYKSRNQLCEMIDYYLAHPEEREQKRRAAYEKTVACHLYRHRCEQLIKIVQERLF